MANTAASDTMPLIPTHPNPKRNCQDGIGSLRPIDGKTSLGNKALGYIHIIRVMITTKLISTPYIAKLIYEYDPKSFNTVGNSKPISVKTKPLITNIIVSQLAFECT